MGMARTGTLLTVALLLLAAALWLLDRRDGVVAGAPGGPSAATTPRAQAEPAREAEAPLPSERALATPAETQPMFRVRGVVLADPAAPDLTGLRVLAYEGHAADRGGLLSAAGRAGPSGPRASTLAPRGDPVAEGRVDERGRFELRAPTPHLRVAIDHDLYLLPAPEIVHVDESSAVHHLALSPLLGGMLRGRLFGSGAAAVDAVALVLEPDPMAALRDARVVLAATAGAARPEARPQPDRSFTFRAVAPGARLRLSASGRGAAGRADEPALVAGEVRDVVLPVGTAARLLVMVHDADGAPLEGARVTVTPADAGATAGLLGERAHTDARGQCAFDALVAGSHEVAATRRGLASARRVIELTAGEVATRAELTLLRGGVVRGVVRGPDGAPVAGASVAHHPSSDVPLIGDLAGQLGPAYLRQISQGGAVSDEDGRFLLSGITDDGAFLVVGSHPDLGAAHARGVRVGDQDVIVALPSLGRIAGSVVEAESRAPVERFTVSVTRRAFLVVEMPVATAYVDDQSGAFSVEGVAAGTYTLRVEAGARGVHEQQITVPDDGDVEGVEVALPRAAGIRGVVRDEDGAPVANAAVRRRQGAMADNPLISMFAGTSRRTYTDPDGRFELTPLRPGALQLLATAPGFATGRSERVRVTAGEQLDGVVIELGHGGAIEGRLRCGVQQRPDDFLLLAKEQVSQNTTTATVAHDGAFRFEDLDPGSYEVQAMPADLMSDLQTRRWRPGEGMDLGEFMRTVTDNVVTQRCRVRNGETTTVELDVRDLTLGAQWRVEVDVAGAPLRGGVLEATSLTTGVVRVALLADGAATFGRVQAGRYRVQVRDGLAMTPVGAPQHLDYPTGADEHTSALSLPGGSLRGRVVDDVTGAPLPGAVVRLHHDAHSERDDAVGACLTDDDGAFRFAGLSDGAYSLRAVGGGGDPAQRGASREDGVEVRGGAATATVELRARPAAAATVLVTAADGRPIRGATAFCVDAAGRPLGMRSAAVTDANGAAFFGGMPDGAAMVVARAPGSAPGISAVQQVSANAPTRFTLQLGPGARTRLMVVDADGARLRGATLAARIGDGPWLPPALLVRAVNGDGTFDLGELGPGRWTFRAQHPGTGALIAAREIAGGAPVTVVLGGR